MNVALISSRSALCAAMLLNAAIAQAALIDRGGGMIYDDVQNITWLQNWNYAATELTDARID